MWWLLVRFAPRLVVAVTGALPAEAPRGASHAVNRRALRQRGLRFLDALLAASPYRGSERTRAAILAFKYRDHPLLHRRLAGLIVTAVRERRVSLDGAVLCPVPCSWRRRHARGYDQAELLDLSVGRTLGLRIVRLLRRRHAPGPQTGRSRAERLAIRADAFAVRRRARVPRRVILIDDVAITGTTLDACAAALKTAGATRVEAWVAAHDPPARSRARPPVEPGAKPPRDPS